MDELHTASELTNRPMSTATHEILMRSRSQTIAGRPKITVATFLYSATQMGQSTKDTASQVAANVFGPAMRGNSFDRLVAENVDNVRGEVSAGLWQAFHEAYSIRQRTGGRDGFIGIRHVLFAIFTSRVPPLIDETSALMEALRASHAKAAREIVQFCIDRMEPQENISAWREIFAARAIEVQLPLEAAGAAADAADGPSSERPYPRDPEVTLVQPDDPSSGEVMPHRRDPEVALLQPDDPWSGEVMDRSGASDEARAFAAMICAREFAPPLAIGVFGEWGSGKSFFMRLVHEAIVDRTREAAHDPAGGIGGEEGRIRFLTNVVQIRFNAWHYAETNLWASLVDHIFTCLDRWAEVHNKASTADKLFDQLATARRLTVESAETLVRRRRDRQQAKSKLAEAEKTLREKRETLESAPATWLQTAWNELLGQRGEKTQLEDAAETLGLGEVTDRAEDLRTAAASLDDVLARYSIFRSATVRALSMAPAVTLITLGIVLLPPALAWVSFHIDETISPLAAAVSGAFAPVALGLTWASKKVSGATAVVIKFRSRLEERVEQLAGQQRAAAAEAELELVTAEAAAAEAEERLRVATDKVVEASRDYHVHSGKGRVLRFVRDRVAGGEYVKHLSFVATVRKDFEELSQLMSPVKAPPEAESARQAHKAHVERLLDEAGSLLEQDERDKLEATLIENVSTAEVFERIVLYIDDLDRCPPEQVVAVLQAIHLLLTFPLFVVLVAVDVRWLKQALVTSYPGQLQHGDIEATASPGDYLEKIFQIPYWVRPMGADNTWQLLADRMGPVRSEPSFSPTGLPEPSGPSGMGSPERQNALAPIASIDGRYEAPKPTSLSLTAGERDYIRGLVQSFDHSPRRTLRFINTYRIMKASLGETDLRALETGGYRALLTLLSIAVNGSVDGAAFVDAAQRHQAGSDLLQVLARHPRIAPALQQLTAIDGTEADLATYSRLVARFSFERGA